MVERAPPDSQVNFRSLQLETVSSLAQKIHSVKSKSKLVDSSLDIGITGGFMPIETGHPQAQILLSCGHKRGKIPFGWL